MTNDNNISSSLVEVARRAGVSKTTVSYVLSGQAKKRRVAKKTASQVLEAAKTLNYVPHLWARNLARQQTKAIGLLFANYELNWASFVMAGLLPVFEANGYIPVTSTHLWDKERMGRELEMALQRRDEGVICQPFSGCNEYYKDVLRRRVPLVFIADTIENMPEVSYVCWDSTPAAKLAVHHLIETGRRRIGYIGFELGIKFAKARYQAYRDTLAEAGLEANNDWIGLEPLIPSKRSGGSVINIVERIMSRQNKPDALFIQHDTYALEALEKLNQMGIRVPDDVAIIGMGDVITASPYGLSTVHEPLEEMGKIAAETMLELIEKPEKGPMQRAISGTELKIRKTTKS